MITGFVMFLIGGLLIYTTYKVPHKLRKGEKFDTFLLNFRGYVIGIIFIVLGVWFCYKYWGVWDWI